MSHPQVGVIHGRFQPVHLGHMEYLLAGKNKCDLLIVGIANPDPVLTKENAADPSRSLATSNPFTYYERMLMIRDSLLESGVPRREFEIVPFPINNPEIICQYVPMRARFFVTVYDEWGRSKVATLRALGVDVEIMWERDKLDRITTGDEIRKLIACGGRWQQLVPREVASLVEANSWDLRFRKPGATDHDG